MNRVLTMIMAGGKGSRLLVLADKRAKPAVPFGGIYRIVDFVLSNAMHSGVPHLGIVTQYRPYSLTDHFGLGESWGFERFGSKAKVLSPYTGSQASSFYKGSADSLYQNIEFIERFPHVSEIVILSSDHIYKMDYRAMLEFHRENGAKLTVATQQVPWEETSRFGIVIADDTSRIRGFQEKPRTGPQSNQASLGIYIFGRRTLLEALHADHHNPDSTHDFGCDIIPRLVSEVPSYRYEFTGYWRDVGTIRSYYETSMDGLNPASGLDLAGWGIRTNHREIPLNHQYPSRLEAGASVSHSFVSKGTLIGGTVINSILSPGVQIERGARVSGCILLHNVRVGEGCVLENAIVDKNCILESGVRIGDAELGADVNRYRSDLLDQGTTVIGKNVRISKDTRIGCNCLLYPDLRLDDRPARELSAGTTYLCGDNGEVTII